VRRTILAAVTVGAATVIVIVGAATASTGTKVEHLSFVSTGTDGAYSVIGTGGFTDGGVARLLNGQGTLYLQKGTIKVTVRPGKHSGRPNLKTCLAALTQSGTYKLVGGTGAYKGISGSGSYVGHFTLVGKMLKGKCSRTANPVAAQLIVRGNGPVTLR
jgi:hypothetical protein